LFAELATPASAQLSTTANGPYYATPSWDQKLTTNRFVILANWNSEAVLDRETGLVWEKVPSTYLFSWFDASLHCLDLILGGRKGWRLPALPELMSLVDRSQFSPALPAGHPFTVQSYVYWSATTFAVVATAAWDVDFGNGSVDRASKPSSYFVWCVRGGPGGDTQ
jgi:hypothetical protein